MLRDGVYLLPENRGHVSAFTEQRDAVKRVGGSAYVLTVSDAAFREEADLRTLFDRGPLYEDWLGFADDTLRQLDAHDEPGARERENRLRRDLDAIMAVDFFPTDGQQVALAKLADVSRVLNARFSPEEPGPAVGQVEPADKADFVGREWATRADLWVDRVASAWLIRRFIDQSATFRWLSHPRNCPSTAVGFDFDGAHFSHVGALVTYQVLLRTFQLQDDESLVQIGDVVRYLDIGGPSVGDAAGILALLAGAKRRSESDDEFLNQAAPLFDHLHAAYGDRRWRKN